MRDEFAQQRLDALCDRMGAEWVQAFNADGTTTVRLHRRGRVVGSATGASLGECVRTHEAIAPRGAPVRDAAHHPALVDVAHRTKSVDYRAESLSDYVQAAAQDPQGRAVRVWVSTDPADAPEDQESEE